MVFSLSRISSAVSGPIPATLVPIDSSRQWPGHASPPDSSVPGTRCTQIRFWETKNQSSGDNWFWYSFSREIHWWRFQNRNRSRFWENPPFRKKNWKIWKNFDRNFEANACNYKICSKIKIVDPLFSLLTYLNFAEKRTVLRSKRSDTKNRDMYLILLKKDVFDIFLKITSFKSNF